MFSGKWTKPEAEIFKDRAVELGVPSDRIITETDSCNTGDNIRFSYRKLLDLTMVPSQAILVQKPHMGRRTLATFEKQWPGPMCEIFVTSPRVSLLDYPNDHVGDLNDVITVVLGYFQRMMEYVNAGFQSYQHIPNDVWIAHKILLDSGFYNGHLI